MLQQLPAAGQSDFSTGSYVLDFAVGEYQIAFPLYVKAHFFSGVERPRAALAYPKGCLGKPSR